MAAFTLSDRLKHAWRHELVFFPVDGTVYGRGDLALLGPDEKPLPQQWVPASRAPAGKNSIAFFASLAAQSTSTYRLVPRSPPQATDLVVMAADDTARMENHLTGIQLGGPQAGRQGPIAAVRLRSGRWVGGGELKSPLAAQRCSGQVLCRGPVYADATVQLRGFARSWLLATLLKSEALAEKGDSTPLPQQYLIRHGDVPLDMVKDYVLRWNDRDTPHPRLFVTATELARFKQTFQPNQETLARLRQTKINPWQMDEAVAYLLATGDAGLARQFAAAAREQLQQAVDEFVLEVHLRTQGTAPPHRTFPVMCSAILADLALGSPAVTDEEQARIKAQLAYLGYTLASPSFHSSARGYRANPNMTTTARGMLGLVACTIPGHPQARAWAKIVLAEIEHELDDWCDANGGWLEAPHYMTVSMDSIVLWGKAG